MDDYMGLPRFKQEAINKGSRRFYNGKPCPHGHVAPRQTLTSKCEVCLAKRRAERYEANKAELLAKAKKRRQDQLRALRDAESRFQCQG